MPFYHIHNNGEPTGYGSTDKVMADAMMEDMQAIYGLENLKLIPEKDAGQHE